MGLTLFFFFVIMPLIELFVIIKVGSEIGALNTIALLIAVSLMGAWLVKRQGMGVVRRVQQQLNAQQMPTGELIDGALLLMAGALLLAPGFVSDVFGILLLIPPIRKAARAVVMRRMGRRTKLIRATYTGPIVDTTSREQPPPTWRNRSLGRSGGLVDGAGATELTCVGVAGLVGSAGEDQMGEAVVSMTRITMGRLLLRRMPSEELAKLVQPQSEPSMAHWTLRCPTGCVIIDVHPDRQSWAQDLARSDAMFRDPIFRFSAEAFSFIDDEHEASTINRLEKAQRATGGYSALAAPPGQLQGRLVSFNRIPRLPDRVRADVWKALSTHEFSSVMQLALRSDSGDLLVDAYLNEDQLIDDFVAVERVLSDVGHSVTNEWYPFTDRPHERALDQLAFALGALDQPPE